MDDKQLFAGLNQLAGEYSSDQVDTSSVIDTARRRIRRRQAMAGATGATVAMLVAMSAVLTTADLGSQSTGSSPPTRPTTRSTGPQPPVVNGQYLVDRQVDQRARRLTNQLAAVKGSLFANLNIAPDPANTRNIRGGTPPALEFGRLTIVNEQPVVPYYTAFAKLTDQQGFGTIRIDVDGSGLARPDLVDCPVAGPVCTGQQFPDGTKASWHTHIGDAAGWNQRLASQRPDGTLIVVSISVWDSGSGAPGPSRPQVPLTADQLYQFAQLFTY